MAIISPDNIFALTTIILLTIAMSVFAEKVRWGRAISAPLIILVLMMCFSNTGVIPLSSPLYDLLLSTFVPVGIVLLLLKADLRNVFRQARPLMLAFGVAVSLTIIGAYVAVEIVDIGTEESKIAGALLASYIGGSVNFVATAETLGFSDPSLYTATLSADAVGAVIFLTLLLALPNIPYVRKRMPSKYLEDSAILDDPVNNSDAQNNHFDLMGISLGLALAFALCTLSRLVVDVLEMEKLFIPVVTFMTLLLANFGHRITSQVKSNIELGTFFMYLFLAAIGAGADIVQVFSTALPIIVFILVLITTHIGLLILLGKYLKLDLAEALIASNACILGPATAAALASSKGWTTLVTPGMLLGILGYSIATFIGVIFASSI